MYIKKPFLIVFEGIEGTGKTTLIKISNASLKATTGSVKWKGTNIEEIKRKEKKRNWNYMARFKTCERVKCSSKYKFRSIRKQKYILGYS